MMARHFLVPPKAPAPQDRLRYWARARNTTITAVGKAMADSKFGSNGRRVFYRMFLMPIHIERAAKFLDLPEKERILLHRLAAQRFGFDIQVK